MRRKSIKLQPHEDHQLRQLYLAFRIPSDQWAQRPRAFARFINEWNLLSGRSDPGDDIRHYIINKRKCAQWVTFDGDYDPLKCPGEETFTDAQWDALRTIYVELNKGRDQYACDTDLRKQLSVKFRERTGRGVSGDLLYAAVMAQQKHKENQWPSLTPERETGRGFRDIDEVA